MTEVNAVNAQPRELDSISGTELEAIRENLADSHTAVVALIGKFTNEELFIKAYFPWTGTTSLGSYFVSATSSHYEWAINPRIHQKAARTTP